jgi:hypothetical protein
MKEVDINLPFPIHRVDPQVLMDVAKQSSKGFISGSAQCTRVVNTDVNVAWRFSKILVSSSFSTETATWQRLAHLDRSYLGWPWYSCSKPYGVVTSDHGVCLQQPVST